MCDLKYGRGKSRAEAKARVDPRRDATKVEKRKDLGKESSMIMR